MQFPGAPFERVLPDNRTVNMPFCFQNLANEEGLSSQNELKILSKHLFQLNYSSHSLRILQLHWSKSILTLYSMYIYILHTLHMYLALLSKFNVRHSDRSELQINIEWIDLNIPLTFNKCIFQ